MKAAETDWQQPSANWSDHLFVTLARMTTQMAVVTDAQRKIVWINNAFTEITGYTLAEAIGANPGQLLQGEMTDPEAVERMRAAMDATKPKPFTEEVLNYTKWGCPIYC